MVAVMRGWRSHFSIPILLGIAFASNAQNPSPWHGGILGTEDSYTPDGQLVRNLTYSDFERIPRHETLTGGSELTYLLDAAKATVYVFARILNNQGEVGRRLTVIPLNNRRAIRTVDYPAVCSACPSCRGCNLQSQIAISANGRYLFTLMERRQEHHQKPQLGQFANDDDASVDEQVILVYDTATGRFLDSPILPDLLSPRNYWLLPSSEPESFEILVSYPSMRLLRYRVAGSRQQKGVVIGELAASLSDADVVRDPVNGRTLFLRYDGRVVEVKDRLKEIGFIEPMVASRKMYSPSVSGNGKLLFVPTGPRDTRNRLASTGNFEPISYIDQIDVYDAANLTRLRTLRSQRPLLEVVPNEDGTLLYTAIPNHARLVILNSDNLWQEAERQIPSPIRQITLVEP